MKYLVISEREILGKSSGDFLDEKELLSAGVNIHALIDGNHIAPTTPEKTTPPSPEGEK